MKTVSIDDLDTKKHPVMLFDGVCNFCDDSIQFLLKRDKKGVYRFASLQSDIGQALLKKHGLPFDEISTVVLIEGEKVYTKSDVGLRAVAHMGGLWPVLGVFSILPKFFRNYIYDIIAKNRYKWFGQKDSCMMPTPDIRSRFLE